MLAEGDRLGQLIAQPVRAMVQNLESLGIAVMPLDVVFHREAETSVNLDGLIRAEHGSLHGIQLGEHRSL